LRRIVSSAATKLHKKVLLEIQEWFPVFYHGGSTQNHLFIFS
jgi:hypothetical protein